MIKEGRFSNVKHPFEDNPAFNITVARHTHWHSEETSDVSKYFIHIPAEYTLIIPIDVYGFRYILRLILTKLIPANCF